jgi:toxin ParE1/3/4
MPRYVLSPAAQRDIESILAWTHEQFETSGRLRYETLLVQLVHRYWGHRAVGVAEVRL